MLLTKEQLTGAVLRVECVPVPELGGDVLIRELRDCDNEILEQHAMRAKAAGGDMLDIAKNMRVLMLSVSIVDEAGELLFAGESGMAVLSKMSSRVIKRLFDKATEINGATPSAIEEVKKE